MKPVSIRFRCFGPYMEEQFIDFSRLEENGLFLICGETGAGKTTILDAMCYALYGKSSGGLRGDMEVMRCALAGKNDETYVAFIFDCGGKRYQFTRSLKYGRKKLNDSHNCMVLTGGEYVPLFANPKATFVNKKAEELIGLSYDQFRQVILLPQGQFEKLLVSDSVEKEKILVSLFHADRWQKIAEEIYRRVQLQDNALKEEQKAIGLQLRQFGCDSIQALEERMTQASAEMETERAALAQASAQLEACRKEREAMLLEREAFRELEKRQNQLAGLVPRKPEFDREEGLLALAEQAQRLLPHYHGLAQARKQEAQAAALLEAGEKELAECDAAVEKALQAQKEHALLAHVQQQRQKDLTLLENARPLYEALREKEAQADRAEKLLREKTGTLERADMAFSRQDRLWQQAMAEQNRAMEEYRQAQSLYLKGIGSVLARELEAGMPCPVCGSVEHPNPAQAVEGHISDAMLEKFNQAVIQAGDRVSRCMSARSGAEAKRMAAAEEHRQASQQAALARQEYEAALWARIPGIDTPEGLEGQIQKLGTKIEAYQRQERILSQNLTQAQGRQIAAREGVRSRKAACGEARTRLENTMAQWSEALDGSGMGTEERFLACSMEPEEMQRRGRGLIRFREQLRNARQALSEQEALLEGKTAPDLKGKEWQTRQLEESFRHKSRSQTLLEQQVSAMEKTHRELEKRSAELERQRLRVDEDLEFANRLRGRSGLSLQRYVLGVMLTSITIAANRLLRNVYGGRYQLYRTDEIAGSGRKGGLELEVHDAASNERRSVTTLSGGEKFLVALSLAIGLSTVVQAQGSGIRLEAMFIDEGFGSLDREAARDALEVLQGIQRGAGVVGIISHVEQLTESIASRIEVRKGENGSFCRITEV